VQEQVVNANALLLEFKPLLQRAVGDATELQMRFHRPLGSVRLDPNQLQATLLSLVGNARDAMPDGGTLRIETRDVVLTDTDVLAMPDARPGRHVRISVEDDGAGMDSATLAQAFEPFFTTKEVGKGTGLGLSQVYGFVRQAGGHCRLRSAPGKGCAVELYFPEAEHAVQALDRAPGVMPLRQASDGDVVLLVEDEDALRELAAESLSLLGYKVLSAPDARVALDILHGQDRVDILFSDVVMPGGMNGAQLAMEARRIRSDLKVLLTSGYTTTATGGVRDLPADVPLLRKPYMRDELAAKLQAVAG
jgi:CheY-like chemotaxis protein